MKASTILRTVSLIFAVSGCDRTSLKSSVSAPGADEAAKNATVADAKGTPLTSRSQASAASTAIEDTRDEAVTLWAAANCQLILQLPSMIKWKTQADASVQIKNLGDDSTTLVMRGDRSFSHSRTPTIA